MRHATRTRPAPTRARVVMWLLAGALCTVLLISLLAAFVGFISAIAYVLALSGVGLFIASSATTGRSH